MVKYQMKKEIFLNLYFKEKKNLLISLKVT